MKKRLALSLLPLALLPAANAAIVEGDIIDIDFGTSATGNNAFTIVNTADTLTTAFSDHALNSGVLRNTLGSNVTGVGFSITNNTGDAAGEAATAAQTQWISNDANNNRLTDGDTVIDGTNDRAYALLTFSGLEDSLTYNFSADHFVGTNNNFTAIWQEVGNVSNTTGAGLATIAFTGLSTDGSGNISFYMIRQSNTDGHHVALESLSLTAVPEPSTYALLAGCLALGSVMLRRRR